MYLTAVLALNQKLKHYPNQNLSIYQQRTLPVLLRQNCMKIQNEKNWFYILPEKKLKFPATAVI